MQVSHCEINKDVMIRVEPVPWAQRRFSRKKTLTALPPEEPTKAGLPTGGTVHRIVGWDC